MTNFVDAKVGQDLPGVVPFRGGGIQVISRTKKGNWNCTVFVMSLLRCYHNQVSRDIDGHSPFIGF